MDILTVIPARYGSSRMPGKPLADICGMPMIWWVYRAAMQSECIDKIVVATDSEKIYSRCMDLNLPVLMTSDDCDTPTDRLCEVANIIESDYYLMLMGDEPLIRAEAIDLMIQANKCVNADVSVLTNQLDNPADVIDFSNQKCVTDKDRNILFISRSPIPYPKGSIKIKYEKVTGIQMFTSESLKFFRTTEKSELEKAEENDLMRFVENGLKVKGVLSPYNTISVDTHKDLESVRTILRRKDKCCLT